MLRHIQLVWSNRITSTYLERSVIDFWVSALPHPDQQKRAMWSCSFLCPTCSLQQFLRSTGTGQAPGNGGGQGHLLPGRHCGGQMCGCRHVSKNKWVTYISLSEVRGESTLQPAARERQGRPKGAGPRTPVITEMLSLVTEPASLISVWFSAKLEIPEETSHKPFCSFPKCLRSQVLSEWVLVWRLLAHRWVQEQTRSAQSTPAAVCRLPHLPEQCPQDTQEDEANSDRHELAFLHQISKHLTDTVLLMST